MMNKEDALSIVYEGILGEDSILVGMRGGFNQLQMRKSSYIDTFFKIY